VPFQARHDPQLEPAAVRAAVARIPPVFRSSPQYVNEVLSARLGDPIVVKVEAVNPIGSFKGRGTWLAVEALAGEERAAADRTIVAASTGNFGQGLAYAARAFGILAVVFADDDANPVKLDRMRHLGATVIQAGRDFDEAREAAERFARERDADLIVDGQDPWIAAGAATIALEVTDAIEAAAVPPIASAYVPLGNGALLTGIGAWLRHAAPACRVVGVAAAAASCMVRSLRSGRIIETPDAATYAEGIACRVPVPEALDMLQGRFDDLVLVSEDQLHAAADELRAATGITAEGAAAASWAGVVAADAAGTRPAGASLVILTGSNVAA